MRKGNKKPPKEHKNTHTPLDKRIIPLPQHIYICIYVYIYICIYNNMEIMHPAMSKSSSCSYLCCYRRNAYVFCHEAKKTNKSEGL